MPNKDCHTLIFQVGVLVVIHNTLTEGGDENEYRWVFGKSRTGLV